MLRKLREQRIDMVINRLKNIIVRNLRLKKELKKEKTIKKGIVGSLHTIKWCI